MEEIEIREKLQQGYIYVRSIIEVLGKPEEHVKKTLADYVELIGKDEDIILLTHDIVKPKPQEELFSIYAEIEMLVKNTASLMAFCFDLMPSSVEILEPDKLTLKSSDFTDFLNDLQARLHAVNMGIQEVQQKNKNLIKNTSTLLRNFVLACMQEPKTLAQVSDLVGLSEDKIEKVVKNLLKLNQIRKEGTSYVVKK